ncbi:hypothetical protein GCM10010532_029140 [Dactylosporangium siamense]
MLLSLRRLLQRLLAAEGAVVTLVTFEFGAYCQIQSSPPPAQYVFIFGGVGSTLVAADGQRLEQVLGADRGILADLQNGLAVAAPLLAGAVAAFLPH